MVITLKKLFHFKYNRIITWIKFYVTLPYHIILHNQEYGWCHGFILCEEPCGHCVDMGLNYGMHCQDCCDLAHELNERRLQRMGIIIK